MKTKFLSIILFAFAVAVSMPEAQAQIDKDARKAAKQKADKDARKEAKKWGKDGYTNVMGKLPLEKQLQRSYTMQYEFDDQGIAKFIFAEGTALAGSAGVASANALNNARVELAGLISAQVANLIKGNMANTQISTEDAQTIDKFVSNSQTFVNADLGVITPVVEAEKKIGKNIERRTVIAYSLDNAKMVANKLIKKELQDDLDANEEDLQKLLGL